MTGTAPPWSPPGAPPPPPFAVVARWLEPELEPLRVAIVGNALGDVGVCEDPPGMNRGDQVDAFNRRFGSPMGSFWCANAAGTWWQLAGATVPPTEVGAVKRWIPWAKSRGAWKEPKDYRPIPGDAVIYGPALGIPNHMGVIVRSHPVILSVEGNTSLGGHDRNGWYVALKRPDLARVLGYILPRPLSI